MVFSSPIPLPFNLILSSPVPFCPVYFLSNGNLAHACLAPTDFFTAVNSKINTPFKMQVFNKHLDILDLFRRGGGKEKFNGTQKSLTDL
jgi:hypothetical protein